MLFNLNKGAFTGRSFQYSGNSDFKRSGTDFMIVLEDSNANGSTFRLLKTIANADICLVAGGKAGGEGQSSDDFGGDGGEVINVYGVRLPAGDYTVTVGESGANTTIVAPDGRTWTAESGKGAEGGHAGKGDDGTLAWNDANTLLRSGWIYGSGGGRCWVFSNNWVTENDAYPGGSIGTASSESTWGHGGEQHHENGYPGFPGTGQGGGAGARVWNGSYVRYAQGPGGRGAVLIRKHKEASA